jgi:hypothetical protein
MRIIVLVFFLILLNQISNTIFTSRTDSSQCITTQNCQLCPQGTGPGCTKPICINGRCGAIEPCSLTLDGACPAAGGGCVKNYLCRACEENMGPPCVQSMCMDGQCVRIQPCTIEIN